jgi:hypothetical protein
MIVFLNLKKVRNGFLGSAAVEAIHSHLGVSRMVQGDVVNRESLRNSVG